MAIHGRWRARLVAALWLAAAPLAAAELFVAVDGDDHGSGTLEKPFATLGRAAAVAREAKGAEPVTVYLRGGVYYLPETLVLDARDSRVVWRAYGEEKAVLSGGREVTGFQPWRDGIYVADVKALGLSKLNVPTEPFYQETPGFELSFNGKIMTLARWPNHDPADIRGGEWAYHLGAPEGDKSRKTFKYYGDRPGTWQRPEEAVVCVFAGWDWHCQDVPMKSVAPEKHEITLATPASYDFVAGRRYYVRNVFEELDAPGEWYYDRKAEKLYFMPPGDIGAGRVSVSYIETGIRLKGASGVTLRNLTLEDFRGSAVTVEGGENVLLAASVVRNTGLFALKIVGGKNHAVVGNDIYDTASGGVWCSGGDRKTLTPSGHQIVNNHIHHFGRMRRVYSVGIQINFNSVGVHVAHNLIHDAPHTAILFGRGNDHVIEYNDIFNVCDQTADCGAIYSGRDLAALGNLIRYNKIHDLDGYGQLRASAKSGIIQYSSHEQIMGVYCDDGGPADINGNIFYRIGYLGVTHGQNSRVENNIFVSDMMAGTGPYFGRLTDDPTRYANLEATRKSVPFDQSPWKERFPILKEPFPSLAWENNRFVNNVVSSEEPLPEYVALLYAVTPNYVIDKNLYWNHGGPVNFNIQLVGQKAASLLSWDKWRGAGFDAHSLVADPQFVDPANDDFQLRDGSPAYGLGFKRIPSELIGLFKDPLRASWPVEVKVRKVSGLGEIRTFRFPPTTPPVEYAVDWAKTPTQADGSLAPAEWDAVAGHYLLAQDDPCGRTAFPLRSKVWVKRGAAFLHVKVESPVDIEKGVKVGPTWGKNDAVELAVRNLARGAESPILALRGASDGTVSTYTQAELASRSRAPMRYLLGKAEAEAISKDCHFTAKTAGPQLWTAEWSVPLQALGVEGIAPAELAFNVSVFRSADNSFLSWRGTGGWTWLLDNNSALKLPGKNK